MFHIIKANKRIVLLKSFLYNGTTLSKSRPTLNHSQPERILTQASLSLQVIRLRMLGFMTGPLRIKTINPLYEKIAIL